MTRVLLPVSPQAAAAADRENPTGRKPHPTAPADKPLRDQWVQSYARNGGATTTRSHSAVGSAKRPCPAKDNNFIELKYLHHDDTPVKGAKYHIESPNYCKSGALDGNGFVRIDGVPQIGGFDFWFTKDPEVYTPAGPKLAAAQGKASAEAEASGFWSWLWGTLQGDFNQDASAGQIATNAIIGLIPVVDQAMDVRDIIAGLKHIIEFYCESEAEQRKHQGSLGLSYEAWLWLGLFIIAIGCIPVLGSAVKGVLKTVIKGLQDAARGVGGLTLAQQQRIWLETVEVLNKLGISQGNAHRWLKELPGRLDGIMAQAATRIDGAIRALDGMVRTAQGQAQTWLGRRLIDNPQALVARLNRVRGACARAQGQLRKMQGDLGTWLKRQINGILPGAHPKKQGGSINTPSKTGGNVQKQGARTPGEPDLPRGASRLGITPSSGHRIVADPNKTTTILGRFNPDTKAILGDLDYPKTADFGPNKGGFNLLNVPPDVEKKYVLADGSWDGDRFWKEQNERFLRDAMERGDNIAMATPRSGNLQPSFDINGNEITSGYNREQIFVEQNMARYGYRWDPVSHMYIKG